MTHSSSDLAKRSQDVDSEPLVVCPNPDRTVRLDYSIDLNIHIHGFRSFWGSQPVGCQSGGIAICA